MGGGGGYHPPKKPNPILEGPKKIWKKIKEFFFGSDESSSSIGSYNSYDSSTAELQETLRISKALEEFRVEVSKQSDKLEEELVSACWEQLDELMAFLRTINDKDYGSVKLKLNLSAMERDNRELVDGIHGSIRKDILAKVNVDNPECEQILRMSAGSEKRLAMKRFMDSAITVSINNLTKKLKKSIEKNCDDIEDKISERLSDINENLETKLKEFDRLSKLSEGETEKLEERQIAVASQMAIYSMWLNLIEMEKG